MHEPLTAALLDVYLIDQTVEPIAAVCNGEASHLDS
jgi:hypothetical protein